jgi:hypothetical protein
MKTQIRLFNDAGLTLGQVNLLKKIIGHISHPLGLLFLVDCLSL